jgi:hypothetical protein
MNMIGISNNKVATLPPDGARPDEAMPDRQLQTRA